MNKSRNRSFKNSTIFILILLLVSFSSAAAAPQPAGQQQPLKVEVNGKGVHFPDAVPYVDENGRTLAPARFVAQALGAEVIWDRDNSKAFIRVHNKSIAMTAGKNEASVNGEKVALDSGSIISENRLYVPVRFVAETLGASVNWEAVSGTVAITMELPIVHNYGISHEKVKNGWHVVPRTFTAWVEAENADKVDFYLTPTGTAQEPVKIATAAMGSDGRFSITHELPEGGYMAHYWAVAVNEKGEGSTGILNVYREDDEQGGIEVFFPVEDSGLSEAERAFVEKVKMDKGVHKLGDLYVVARGQQPNPGYGIKMVKSQMETDRAVVYVRLTEPEPDMMYAAVIVYPYLAGRIHLNQDVPLVFINADNGEIL